MVRLSGTYTYAYSPMDIRGPPSWGTLMILPGEETGSPNMNSGKLKLHFIINGLSRESQGTPYDRVGQPCSEGTSYDSVTSDPNLE